MKGKDTISGRFFVEGPYRTIAPLLFLLLAACSTQNDQLEFEQEAFQEPDGSITRTNESGEIEGSRDQDWQVAPFFVGEIEVDPPYPNPVLSTGTILLEFYVVPQSSITNPSVYVLFDDGSPPKHLDLISENPLSSGYHQFLFEARDLSRFTDSESISGLKRILVMDGRDSVISYGDILVE